MTPSSIDTLVSKHLDGWLNSTEGGPCLRIRVADAIREAIKHQDQLWADGNATLRHERDHALEQLRAMTQCRDDAVAAAHLLHEKP